MPNFWENLFTNEGALWDFNPSDSALIALDLFNKNRFKKILIPGVGYGRNAKPFFDAGFEITGIEISNSAIELAKENNLNVNIHKGTLLNMPFDNEKYEGIFCYATLHLFNKQQRQKILNSCYNQLVNNGLMFFNVVSIDSINDFTGNLIGDNLMKLENGLELHFSNLESIKKEFEKFNIIDISKIAEPIKHMENQKPLHCFNITCEKI